ARYGVVHAQFPRGRPGRAARRGLPGAGRGGRLRVRQVRLGAGPGGAQGGAVGAAGGHGAMSAGAATVRRLGPGDLAAVRAMLAMMGTAFGEEATFTEAPPGDAYLERLLARNGVVALAAFDGPDVVGGLVAYVLEKFEQERSEVYLYDLA